MKTPQDASVPGFSRPELVVLAMVSTIPRGVHVILQCTINTDLRLYDSQLVRLSLFCCCTLFSDWAPRILHSIPSTRSCWNPGTSTTRRTRSLPHQRLLGLTANSQPRDNIASTLSASNMPETTKVVPLTCHGHSRPVPHIHFSSMINEDQYYIISACKDGNPMLRDGITGDWIGTFLGHKGAVWQARLSSDASLAATASADFSAYV